MAYSFRSIALDLNCSRSRLAQNAATSSMVVQLSSMGEVVVRSDVRHRRNASFALCRSEDHTRLIPVSTRRVRMKER